jgi:hypothetical protein
MNTFINFSLVFSLVQCTIIPVGFERSAGGRPFINVSIPSLHGNDVLPFFLYPKERAESAIRTSANETSQQESSVEVSLLNSLATPIRVVYDNFIIFYQGSDYTPVFTEPERFLGIGRGSPLLRYATSMDFIRPHGNETFGSLRLNGTEESFFVNNCNASTGVRLDLLQTNTWMRLSINGIESPLAMSTMISGTGILVFLPASYTQLITDITGVQSSAQEIANFADCSRLREVLPVLTLRFLSNNDRIVLYPEDYTRLNEDNTCGLLVGTFFIERRASINPLLIPQVNVRFTEDKIVFCDTTAG